MSSFRILNSKGFSLVELAIVILISGLFLVAALNFWKKFNDNRIAVEMSDKIELIKLSLGAYIFDEPDNDSDPVRFPCPAPLNLNQSESGYGFERCPWKEKDRDNERLLKRLKAGDDIGGVFVLESLGDKPLEHLKKSYSTSTSRNKNFILIGAVPASTLQIPVKNMTDPYGNLFLYAVTLSLTKEGALLSKPSIAGAIRVVDGADETITKEARFFLYSSGQDGFGGFSGSGYKLPQPCRDTLEGDALNCQWQKNDFAVFRVRDGFSHGQNSDYYDDTTTHRMFSQKDLIGWWQSLDSSGKNITTKNEGAVVIGNVQENQLREDDKLFVDGNVKTRGLVFLDEENTKEEESCEKENIGVVRYRNGTLEFCNGRDWRNLIVGGFGCSGKQVLQGVKYDGSSVCVTLPTP